MNGVAYSKKNVVEWFDFEFNGRTFTINGAMLTPCKFFRLFGIV